ncbi:hypothetical protein OROGR_021168 [Orobanche gracilis]
MKYSMLLLSMLLLTHIFTLCKATDQLKTHIVHVKKPEEVGSPQPQDLDTWYRSFVPPTPSSTTQRVVHTYRNVMTGFAARLTSEEVRAMEKKDGFLSAFPERVLKYQTTRTPQFLGLNQGSGFWDRASYGEGQIIAVIDSGIDPKHPSFDGLEMPAPPAKWKGKCEFEKPFCTNNNKIIGARNFVDRGKPPLDDVGHGTHTASTAAGRPVEGAESFGQYNGTATGIAPLAHLAIYKVGDGRGIPEGAVIAGMDAAIEDGADVLSISLGGKSLPFYKDSLAIAAFQAIQKGIFVTCSAGNWGPSQASLSNEAPWILTVGASSVDRNIKATVLLGNNGEFDGQSMYQPSNFSLTPLPLVYPGANGDESVQHCEEGSLNNTDVQGKIVVCMIGDDTDSVRKGQVVKDAGGAGMIVADELAGDKVTEADLHVLPASNVDHDDGLSIKDYIKFATYPVATILFRGTVFGVPYGPQVATWSSRGPSLSSPGIMKPDILGPGDHILAAWPADAPPDCDFSTEIKSTFVVCSGTSMAAPHLSGIAALLKNMHPDWSPAEIKSAIMTTADILNHEGHPITDNQFDRVNSFCTGSGQVNPSKAYDPGLVYDVHADDYIPYLCGLKYTDQQVGQIVQRTVNCSESSSIPEAQLNYPSFSIHLEPSRTQTYTRTVTNVGEPSSCYTSKVVPPPGVEVKVTPSVISFSKVNQIAMFKVAFSRKGDITSAVSQGYLMWVSGDRTVRSPIIVQFV